MLIDDNNTDAQFAHAAHLSIGNIVVFYRIQILANSTLIPSRNHTEHEAKSKQAADKTMVID